MPRRRYKGSYSQDTLTDDVLLHAAKRAVRARRQSSQSPVSRDELDIMLSDSLEAVVSNTVEIIRHARTVRSNAMSAYRQLSSGSEPDSIVPNFTIPCISTALGNMWRAAGMAVSRHPSQFDPVAYDERTTYRQLKMLADEYDDMRVEFVDDEDMEGVFVHFTTPEIECTCVRSDNSFSVGDITMHLCITSLTTGRSGVRCTRGPNATHGSYVHPHVYSGDGHVCYGEAEPQCLLLWRAGMFMEFVDVLIDTLHQYNPASPYNSMRAWIGDVYECYECGDTVLADDDQFEDWVSTSDEDMTGLCQECSWEDFAGVRYAAASGHSFSDIYDRDFTSVSYETHCSFVGRGSSGTGTHDFRASGMVQCAVSGMYMSEMWTLADAGAAPTSWPQAVRLPNGAYVAALFLALYPDIHEVLRNQETVHGIEILFQVPSSIPHPNTVWPDRNGRIIGQGGFPVEYTAQADQAGSEGQATTDIHSVRVDEVDTSV